MNWLDLKNNIIKQLKMFKKYGRSYEGNLINNLIPFMEFYAYDFRMQEIKPLWKADNLAFVLNELIALLKKIKNIALKKDKPEFYYWSFEASQKFVDFAIKEINKCELSFNSKKWDLIYWEGLKWQK